MSTSDEYLTAQEIADRFGWKLETVHRYRHNGTLPPPDRMFGRTPVWKPATIDRWDAGRPGRGARTDLQQAPEET